MSAAAFQFDLLSTNLNLVLLQHDCMSRSSSSFYSQPIRLKGDVHVLLQQTQRCAALAGALKPRQFASADAPTTSNGTVRTIGRIGTSAVQALPHAERMPC